MENDLAFGYPVKTAKELGLEKYFKENPQVAGMAWGGGENGSDPKSERVIVANPFNKYMADPEKRTGLLKIEAARHLMGEKQYDPSFDINEEQQTWRKGLGKYADNDLAFKQSIISRILAGDDVPSATKQQMDEAGKIEAMLMSKAKPMGAKEAVKNQLKQDRQDIPERLGNFKTNWNTPLSKDEEKQYLKYQKALGDRGDDTHYDLRGYWLKYGRNEDLKNPEAHFTDEFKKPSYATFSKDSYYNNSMNPDGTLNVGGEWIGDEEFIPSQEMWGNPQKKKALLEHQGREEMEKISTGKGFKITQPSSEPMGAIDHVQMMMKQYGIK